MATDVGAGPKTTPWQRASGASRRRSPPKRAVAWPQARRSSNWTKTTPRAAYLAGSRRVRRFREMGFSNAGGLASRRRPTRRRSGPPPRRRGSCRRRSRRRRGSASPGPARGRTRRARARAPAAAAPRRGSRACTRPPPRRTTPARRRSTCGRRGVDGAPAPGPERARARAVRTKPPTAPAKPPRRVARDPGPRCSASFDARESRADAVDAPPPDHDSPRE